MVKSFMLKRYRKTEYGNRAKRKYRETHAEELKQYNREYYLRVLKAKRAALRNHQVS